MYIHPEDPKFKRCRRVAFWIYGLILLVAFFAGAQWAHAQPIPLHVLEKDEVTVKLMNTPCVDPVSTRIAIALPAELFSKLQAIESNWAMKDGSRRDYAGCWVELTLELAGVEGYFVAFSDGTYGVIQKEDFRKTKGAVGT